MMHSLIDCRTIRHYVGIFAINVLCNSCLRINKSRSRSHCSVVPCACEALAWPNWSTFYICVCWQFLIWRMFASLVLILLALSTVQHIHTRYNDTCIANRCLRSSGDILFDAQALSKPVSRIMVAMFSISIKQSSITTSWSDCFMPMVKTITCNGCNDVSSVQEIMFAWSLYLKSFIDDNIDWLEIRDLCSLSREIYAISDVLLPISDESVHRYLIQNYVIMNINNENMNISILNGVLRSLYMNT